MNNFYGWAMSSYLPYGRFKRLKNVDGIDVNSINEKSSIGYIILDVYLEYPEELYLLHNDYPLAPEKLANAYGMLSDYCKKIAHEYGIKVGDGMILIPNLGKKTNYVLYYRNLQSYLSLGMKLKKFIRSENLSNLTGWKNMLILTLEKEQMLLKVLKKIFF